MGHALLLLFILGAGYFLLREPDEAPAVVDNSPQVTQGSRVWLLGDSLAVGLFEHLQSLADVYDVELDATTKVGAPTAWGADHAESRQEGDELWIVVLGANDAAGLGDVSEHVEAIILAARRSRSRLVWAIAPDGGVLPRYEKVFGDIQSRWPYTIKPPSGLPMAPDGVHLTPDGYRQWARHIWDRLTRSEKNAKGDGVYAKAHPVERTTFAMRH